MGVMHSSRAPSSAPPRMVELRAARCDEGGVAGRNGHNGAARGALCQGGEKIRQSLCVVGRDQIRSGLARAATGGRVRRRGAQPRGRADDGGRRAPHPLRRPAVASSLAIFGKLALETAAARRSRPARTAGSTSRRSLRRPLSAWLFAGGDDAQLLAVVEAAERGQAVPARASPRSVAFGCRRSSVGSQRHLYVRLLRVLGSPRPARASWSRAIAASSSMIRSRVSGHPGHPARSRARLGGGDWHRHVLTHTRRLTSLMAHLNAIPHSSIESIRPRGRSRRRSRSTCACRSACYLSPGRAARGRRRGGGRTREPSSSLVNAFGNRLAARAAQLVEPGRPPRLRPRGRCRRPRWWRGHPLRVVLERQGARGRHRRRPADRADAAEPAVRRPHPRQALRRRPRSCQGAARGRVQGGRARSRGGLVSRRRGRGARHRGGRPRRRGGAIPDDGRVHRHALLPRGRRRARSSTQRLRRSRRREGESREEEAKEEEREGGGAPSEVLLPTMADGRPVEMSAVVMHVALVIAEYRATGSGLAMEDLLRPSCLGESRGGSARRSREGFGPKRAHVRGGRPSRATDLREIASSGCLRPERAGGHGGGARHPRRGQLRDRPPMRSARSRRGSTRSASGRPRLVAPTARERDARDQQLVDDDGERMIHARVAASDPRQERLPSMEQNPSEDKARGASGSQSSGKPVLLDAAAPSRPSSAPSTRGAAVRGTGVTGDDAKGRGGEAEGTGQ